MDNPKNAVLTALRGVIDPEVGLDIVTMGLVYDLAITPDEVRVAFTLTTRGCPMGETLFGMAWEALEGIAGGRRVRLELVWDPPWSPLMISPEGREFLGV